MRRLSVSEGFARSTSDPGAMCRASVVVHDICSLAVLHCLGSVGSAHESPGCVGLRKFMLRFRGEPGYMHVGGERERESERERAREGERARVRERERVRQSTVTAS